MTLATPQQEKRAANLSPAQTYGTSLGDMPVRRFPFAPEMILLLRPHFGAPAHPIVREGQEVVRGEPIAEPLDFLSVSVHAPVTGVISRIDEYTAPSGTREPAIFLRTYPGASQEILYGAPVDADALAAEALGKAIQDAGIVGQGGVGFPTHAKLSLPDDRYVDALVVSTSDSEEGFAGSRRLILERPNDLALGLKLVLKALGAKLAVVAVEAAQTDCYDTLRRHIPADVPVTLIRMPQAFPPGSHRELVQKMLNREMPEGGLPLDAHAAVFNVATLAQIGELLARRGGLIERVVSVTGPGIARPGNYLMPVGTPLAFVLEQTGLKPSATDVFLGGPDAGVPHRQWDFPITKEVTGVRVAAVPFGNGANGHAAPGLLAALSRFFSR